MTKTQQRFTAYQRQGTELAAFHYRTAQAMADDLGVQVYHDTYRMGRLLRDGQSIGTWEMWSVAR